VVLSDIAVFRPEPLCKRLTLLCTCMKAFDVRLNGKQLCIAGIGGDGSLNTMIDFTAGQGKQRLSLRVGGLAADTDELVTWSVMSLNVGDEITLRIIDADSVDPPRTRIRRDAKSNERDAEA
jgi:hypothetical protein